ncbi:glycosyltransferase [Labilibacter marinus]|uniref:glycosyltransferase n=1 Tax=Labilibacter marinus TaxID=1477105 RepID=UPI00094FA905|nr:glycosyltransferase [Labilibacter marinus]
MRVSFFNTFLQGGAAYGAINLFTNLLTQNDHIVGRFNYMQDLTNGQKQQRLKHKGHYQAFHPITLNKNPLTKLSNSFKARKYYAAIKKHIKDCPKEFEQFHTAWQYYKSPYKWFSNKLPDIIHLHWVAKWIDYPSFFNSIPDNTPIIWTLHDQNPMTGGCHYSWECKRYKKECNTCPQLGTNSKGDLALKNWETKFNALKNKNLHIVGDSTWITHEAQLSPLFASAKSFQTIHYSIDFNTFKPSNNRNSLLAKYNIPKNAFVICFGAADFTNRRKGFLELMVALRLIKEKNNNIHCLVFGAGKLDTDTSHLPPIHFTGRLNANELAEVYGATDIFIIPSLYEAFGLTAIESMACGTPVIGFNTGGIPDSVKEGISGWLVEKGNSLALADKILYLEKNRKEVEAIAQSAIPFVRKNFNKEREVEAYWELYNKVLGARL